MDDLWHRLMVFERLVLAGLLLTLTVGLLYTGWLWRWDQTLYDAYIKRSPRLPAKDIVIVAIDAASLQQLGAWPWPRNIHAQLVDQLTRSGAKAIVFDVLFADATDPEDDKLFAQAIANSERVILSVLVEQPRPGSSMLESLPTPELAASAAALGHVHFELDQDGIARSLYLMSGLSTPRWSALGLAAVRFLKPHRWQSLPGVHLPMPLFNAPYVWVQNYRVMIPFLGFPGSYPAISYVDALQTQHTPTLFQDKIVLIGSTVTGLSDTLPTPVSGLSQPMAGVEIHANVIDGLRRGIMIEPLPTWVRWTLSVCIVLFPVLIYPLVAPRIALLISVVLILGSLTLSFLWLRYFNLWFAPLPLIMGLSISYPLWSWRRLEYTLRYLDTHLDTLQQVTLNWKANKPMSLLQAMTCAQQRLPVNGWVLKNSQGQVLEQSEHTPGEPPKSLRLSQWQYQLGAVWTLLTRHGETLLLGLSWNSDEAPQHQQYFILTELIRSLQWQKQSKAYSTVEFVQNRIKQIQRASVQLDALQDLMADSLAEMADGVLIIDIFGIVLLANKQAAHYLHYNSELELFGIQSEDLIKQLEGIDVPQWRQMLDRVISESIRETVYTRHPEGSDFVIQISSLPMNYERRSGVIVNITDVSALKESERKRTELLGFLSHDLRSPMVSILSLLELKQAQFAQHSSELQFLEHIKGYTQRVLTLSEDFLYLAKADSLKQINFHSVDLIDIAYNALQQVWPQAVKKKIRIVQRFEIDEARVFGDAQLLERVMINLLTNAIKYSSEHSQVELSLQQEESTLSCCIRDNGGGISAEFLPNVFDRFSREKNKIHVTQRGSGLGLAFVKQTVEKHGGRVDVSSKVGMGSCFCLIFPVE